MGAVTAGFTNEIGNFSDGSSSWMGIHGYSAGAQLATRTVLHGALSSFMSAARGGKWSAGFWGGAVGTYLGAKINLGKDYFGNVAKNAMISGTVSRVTGGKFSNGAIMGAFRYMFNDSLHKVSNDKNAWDIFHDWLKGKGGEQEYYFASDHPMTIDLQGSPKLQRAINQWILEGHNIGEKDFLKVDAFMPFGEGMLNSTRQIVGSFTASIYQLEEYKVGVFLYNNMSIKSAVYHLGFPDNYGTNYQLKQYYYFEETY